MRRLLLPVLVLGFASANALAADGHDATTFNGRISGIDSATITVRDGNRSATCFLTGASPSVTGFAVGQHVKLACRKKILVGIALKGDVGAPKPAPATTTTVATTGTTTTTTTTTTATPPAAAATTGISGTITALSTTSLTVHDGDRDVTCSLGSTSPSLAGYAVGTHAKIGCVDGVLASIAPVTSPVTSPEQHQTTTTTTPSTTAPAPTTTTTTTASGKGSITALTSTSITVTGDRALTCSIGSGSPNPADYGLGVGAHVTITCVNGTLTHVSV